MNIDPDRVLKYSSDEKAWPDTYLDMEGADLLRDYRSISWVVKTSKKVGYGQV